MYARIRHTYVCTVKNSPSSPADYMGSWYCIINTLYMVLIAANKHTYMNNAKQKQPRGC